jgi:hypothetical protein
MTATASEPIHLGTYPAAWNRVRARGRDEDLDVSSSMWSWTTLMDGVMLLGVVWSIPIAVLVVGTPVALAIAFLLSLVRLTLRAF